MFIELRVGRAVCNCQRLRSCRDNIHHHSRWNILGAVYPWSVTVSLLWIRCSDSLDDSTVILYAYHQVRHHAGTWWYELILVVILDYWWMDISYFDSIPSRCHQSSSHCSRLLDSCKVFPSCSTRCCTCDHVRHDQSHIVSFLPLITFATVQAMGQEEHCGQAIFKERVSIPLMPHGSLLRQFSTNVNVNKNWS